MKSLSIFLLVAISTASAYQIPYFIFMDCYDPICRINDLYGFHCKNGLCSYVCNSGGCRPDGLPSRSLLGASNLIFYGCESPVCIMDGFYGYDCNHGACQYVCSDSGCYEGNREISDAKKGKRNRRKMSQKYKKLSQEIEDREELEKNYEEIDLPDVKPPRENSTTTTTTTEHPTTTTMKKNETPKAAAPSEEVQPTTLAPNVPQEASTPAVLPPEVSPAEAKEEAPKEGQEEKPTEVEGEKSKEDKKKRRSRPKSRL